MSALARPPRAPVSALLTALVVALVVSACGSAGPAPAAPPPAMQASPLTGPLTVLAAEPLGAAFQDARGKLANTNPGLALSYDFAAGPALAQRLRQGAGADLVAADEATVRAAADSGLVEAPTVFANQTGTGGPVGYSIAAVKASRNQAAAQAFVGYLTAGRGQRILQAHGFTAP